MAAKWRANEGFSLTELMLVIGLLALVGLSAASSLDIHSWLSAYRLRASARRIFLDMQKARLKAIKDNRDWAIRFDPDDRSYTFQYRDANGNWVDSGENCRLDQGIRFGTGSANLDATDARHPLDTASYISFTGNKVTFNSLGLPTKSGYCYICSSDGTAYAIGTNTCGVIKMKRWHNHDWGS